MATWDRCSCCDRIIPVGELCYGIKDGNTFCQDCCKPENFFKSEGGHNNEN